MYLSAHFTTDELGNPPSQYLGNARELAELLEGFRSVLGVPLDVSSGYRTPDRNASLQGAAQASCHLTARAADFEARGLTIFEVAGKLTVADDQGLLPDYGEMFFYAYTGHVHVSLPGCGGFRERLVKFTQEGDFEGVTADSLARLPGASVKTALGFAGIAIVLLAVVLALKGKV